MWCETSTDLIYRHNHYSNVEGHVDPSHCESERVDVDASARVHAIPASPHRVYRVTQESSRDDAGARKHDTYRSQCPALISKCLRRKYPQIQKYDRDLCNSDEQAVEKLADPEVLG